MDSKDIDMRNDGRSSMQARPVRMTPNYTKHALGSVLVEFGDTKVLCSVTMEESVPNWLRSSRHQRGWLTAEYSMLPSSTQTRSRRERSFTGGRTQEIQRLIGRSLRGIVDLTKCPDKTFMIDCDVLQADGGTRCASITGAYAALKLSVDRLLRSGKLKQSPIVEGVAAISIGRFQDEILVDLNYEEDSKAEFDMNVVMTQGGKLLEIQGTAEGSPFSKADVIKVMDSAEDCLGPIFELQNIAAEGQVAEG